MGWHGFSQATFDVMKRWASLNERQPPPSKVKFEAHNRWDTVSYHYDTCFSYRTAIAKYHRSERNQLYVLLTSDRYSLTTQKHKGWLLRAVNVKVFEVPHIGVTMERKNMHAENIIFMKKHVYDLMAKAIKKFRDDDIETWRFFIECQFKALRQYEELTGEKVNMQDSFEDIMMTIENSRSIKLSQWNDPKAVARREREAARKLARKVFLGE